MRFYEQLLGQFFPGVKSLAYIGTDLSTAQRVEHDHRSSRFRLGDKKEAAGVCRGRGPCRGPYRYIWNFASFGEFVGNRRTQRSGSARKR
jgi:hypothetical protein